jgi:peptide/nickel transport system permease protein
MLNSLRTAFKQIVSYPSAMIGSVIILILVLISIYAIISIPRSEAVYLWRGGEAVWKQNPKNAFPIWTNWFREEKLPLSQQITTDDPGVTHEITELPQGSNEIITITFDYTADDFPQDMAMYFVSDYESRNPFASVLWYTPDGREYRIFENGIETTHTYRFKQDTKLQRRLGGLSPEVGLFADPNIETPTVLKGTYTIVIDALNFEDEGSIAKVEFILHGKVHGWFGTDHFRRDLGIAMLWGTPIALSFGLIASLGSSVLSMVIAAIGVWWGGWVDDLIQRVTEVGINLPFLNILILIGTFYSRSIWTLLIVTVVLSIFSGAIKANRAIFLQTKEASYIEAAKAYGASNSRIIFNYLIPRIIPTLIPTLVLGVPTFVFLEATLAVLGLGDPVLPTWGKVIQEANNNGAVYNGYYYWILEPAVLLVITGLGFAMLGFALDRVFNPRLREI